MPERRTCLKVPILPLLSVAWITSPVIGITTCSVDELYLGHRFGVDPDPMASVLGDLDGDGHLDLVMAAAGEDQIAIRLGFGDGRFGRPTYYPSVDWPVPIALTDLNDDDALDLIVLDPSDNRIRIRLGLNDGTFGEHQVHMLPGQLDSRVMAEGDFNNDGHLDLAVPFSSAQTPGIQLLLGDGEGAFTPTTVDLRESPDALAAGDVNGDGNADLVVGLSQFPSATLVLLGTGHGTFVESEMLPSPGLSMDIALHDLDTDGFLDIVQTCYTAEPQFLQVWRGTGDGSFDTGVTYELPSQRIHQLAVADLTTDGIADIIVAIDAVDTQGWLQLFTGIGDGTFEVSTAYSAGIGPRQPALGDLNDDGLTDVLVSSTFSDDVTILFGRPDGELGFENAVDTIDQASLLTSGDVNGDGADDLVVGSDTSAQARVELSNGDGTFSPLPEVTLEGPLLASLLADFNGDGLDDLATLTQHAAPHHVAVSLATGGGLFAEPGHFVVGTAPAHFTAEDLNGDGTLDLLVSNTGSNDLSVLLGLGDGSFAPDSRVPLASSPGPLAVGDVTGDGWRDIAVAQPGTAFVGVLASDRSGGFTPQENHPIGSALLDLEIADLDADGRSDLLLAVRSGSNRFLFVMLASGGGAFDPIDVYPTTTSLDQLVVIDLNGDGKLDVMSTARGQGEITVFPGVGDGSFETHLRLGAGRFPIAPIAADFDADQQVDFAVVNEYFSTITVLLNQCATCAADVDSDSEVGFLDLVIVLDSWGPCPDCSADIDGDGAVTFQDLLQVLGSWGPCP